MNVLCNHNLSVQTKAGHTTQRHSWHGHNRGVHDSGGDRIRCHLMDSRGVTEAGQHQGWRRVIL